MAARLPQIAARLGSGVILEKVTIDPDELLAFARKHHGGKIDTHIRSEFAARIVAQKIRNRSLKLRALRGDRPRAAAQQGAGPAAWRDH